MYLPEPIKYITQRVNSDVNYGFGVIMTCQYEPINSNKHLTVVWKSTGAVGKDTELCGNFVHCIQFCCDPKTSLKNEF